MEKKHDRMEPSAAAFGSGWPLSDPAVRRRWQRAALYALAIALSLAMLFVRNGLPVSFGERPLLILFMLPVIASALLGGFGPGLTATAVAAAGTAYAFIPPINSLFPRSTVSSSPPAMIFSSGGC